MERALVLAGGQATRLRPLTDETPKGLLPLGPACVLDLQLAWLRAGGVEAVTIAAGPFTEAVADRLGSGPAEGPRLHYLAEPDPVGSGGALREAARTWTTPFWVLNGDVLVDLDLRAMAARHAESGAWASIAMVAVPDGTGFGVLDVGPGDAIRRFVEKPAPDAARGRWINAGVWRFQPEVRGLLPADGFASVEYALFPAILAAGRRLQGMPVGRYWVDMGTPDRYRRVAEDLVRGDLPIVPGWPRGCPDGRWLAPSARIDAEARVTGPALIGPDSHLQGTAQVHGSVLWDHVTVETDTIIQECIIANDVVVGAGVRLERVIVGPHARIRTSPPPGARVATGAQI